METNQNIFEGNIFQTSVTNQTVNRETTSTNNHVADNDKDILERQKYPFNYKKWFVVTTVNGEKQIHEEWALDPFSALRKIISKIQKSLPPKTQLIEFSLTFSQNLEYKGEIYTNKSYKTPQRKSRQTTTSETEANTVRASNT